MSGEDDDDFNWFDRFMGREKRARSKQYQDTSTLYTMP